MTNYFEGGAVECGECLTEVPDSELCACDCRAAVQKTSEAPDAQENFAKTTGKHDSGEAYIMEDEDAHDTLAMANNRDQQRYTIMETVMDSGSSDNVTGRATAPHVPVVPGAGPQRGQKWSRAGSGGKSIINEGEQHLPLYTMDGAPCPMTYQVADVRKSFTSVAKVCDRNNRVVFTRHGGIIQNLDNGNCTPFPRKGDIYTLSMMLDTASGPPSVFQGRS